MADLEEAMGHLFWLSDDAWAAIEPHLPKNQPGARRVDDRRVISGILHVVKSGCRWRDCPSAYGPRTTIYNRFNRWSRRRITAERVVVNGRVEGPIQGGEVVLKFQAHVVGDIRHQSLTIEKGAYFDGRAAQAHDSNGSQPATLDKNKPREVSREANTAAE
jgi:hypothetical protein